MKVSVIVLSHNGEKVIGRCLRSVKETDYSDLEVILVDNDSQDETYSIACEILRKDEIIKTGKKSKPPSNLIDRPFFRRKGKK